MSVLAKYWFKKEQLVWGKGPSILLFSATAIVVLTGYMYSLKASGVNIQGSAFLPELLRAIAFLLVIAGTPGGALLYLSMWYYWAQIDSSDVWVKRVWFFVLLVGFWYASVLYYLLVYRPQVAAFRRGAWKVNSLGCLLAAGLACIRWFSL
jgi:hypothetical protein